MPSLSTTSAERTRNSLLTALEPAEYSQLLDGAESVHLPLRTVLYEANGPIAHVFFLERGVASIIAPVGDGVSVEVGTVGNEGFIGLPLLFGADREPNKAFIQIADGGVRVTSRCAAATVACTRSCCATRKAISVRSRSPRRVTAPTRSKSGARDGY